MDYATLVGSKGLEGSIRNWVNRGDVPATTVLTEAEAWIYEHLRVREMQRLDTAFTFSAGSSTANLPEGFQAPIEFRPYGWGSPLPYYHEQALDALTDEDGEMFEAPTPSQWTIIGEEAHLNVKVEDDFKGRLLYHGTPDPLSSANPSNFLTRRYPRLLRVVCCAFAFEHMKDRQAANDKLVEARGLIFEANQTNENYRQSQYVPAS